MANDIFEIKLSEGVLIFLVVESGNAPLIIEQFIKNSGGISLGPMAWWCNPGAASGLAISSIVDELEPADCIYVISLGSGDFRAEVVTGQARGGGLTIGS